MTTSQGQKSSRKLRQLKRRKKIRRKDRFDLILNAVG